MRIAQRKIYWIKYIKTFKRKKNNYNSSGSIYKTMSNRIVRKNKIAETLYPRTLLESPSQTNSY